ncbi:hypothetical protein ACH5RR_006493 [Cinchona calisaya]|uniref:Uncharacterized protein n=1 Tax=Cinchona calisaya TaxID=153742 RepID=A0ABD3AP58_9GENT
MVSRQNFRVVTTILAIPLATIVNASGSVLVARANTCCFGFIERYFVTFGELLVVPSFAGKNRKNYPRCYVGHMIANLPLVLAAIATPIAFWTMIAAPHHSTEQWRIRRIDHGWPDVRR